MGIENSHVKEYNTWTIWNITNKREYYDELKSFLTKNLNLQMRNGGNSKRGNNLMEFGFAESKAQNKQKNQKFKCLFLMTSNPKVKDYIFLNMIRKNKEIENKVDKKIKSLHDNGLKKYKRHYYKISFENTFEVNKRELAKSIGLDYDNMQYRVIKMKGSEGGTMIIFKHAIEFLAYPSKKAFDKDKEMIVGIIKNNIIKVHK